MRIYKNNVNKGVGYTRNRLLSLATGKYIYFLDSDDHIVPYALEKAYKVAEEKSLDMLMFKIRHFDELTKKEFTDYYTEMHYLKRTVGDRIFTFDDVKMFALEMSVNLPGKLLKRDLVQDIRFPEECIFEDNPFFFEALIKAKRIYFYKEYLCNKCERKSSIMTGNDERYLGLTDTLDNLTEVAKRYDKYEEMKPYLIQYFISLNQLRIRGLGLKIRFKFFKKMKEFYIRNKDKIEEVYDEIYIKYQAMFDAALKSDNYITYELRVLYRINRYFRQLWEDEKMEDLMWFDY